ncbi:1 U5 small nuclear ribonucleoprotein component [Hortaea werneckii]|nr:1 U5 small nuclear ribonucleoprotein component [Hortaea werneckii]
MGPLTRPCIPGSRTCILASYTYLASAPTWPGRPEASHASSTPLSLNCRTSSGSKYLVTFRSSLRPFLLLVLRTKSLAVACALAGSNGRNLIDLSSGSPGTVLQRSNTSESVACPCVWMRRSVSNLRQQLAISFLPIPQMNDDLPERINHGDQPSHTVQRRSRHGTVTQHMSSPPRQHGIQRTDGIGRAQHCTRVDRLHQPRTGHEETRVHAPSGRRDNLSAAAEDSLISQLDIGDLELGVTNRLLAQRSLPRAPAETLSDTDVGTHVFRSGSPDVAGGEEVVAVVLGEEGADFSYGVLDGDFAGFNVLGDTVVQRFGDHGDLVLLVWALQSQGPHVLHSPPPSPANIFGSSLGLIGSTAILKTLSKKFSRWHSRDRHIVSALSNPNIRNRPVYHVLFIFDTTRPNALKLLASEVLKSLLRSAYLGGQARAKELGADQTQKLLRITLELTWLQDGVTVELVNRLHDEMHEAPPRAFLLRFPEEQLNATLPFSGVDFFNDMLELEICVRRRELEFQNQAIHFVDQNSVCVCTPSTTSTTRTTPSARRIEAATSSAKLTSRDIGEDLTESPRSRSSMWLLLFAQVVGLRD